MVAKKTPCQNALDHGEQMAQSVEWAIKVLDGELTKVVESGDEAELDGDVISDAFKNMRLAIHEFRKRAMVAWRNNYDG